MQIDLIFDPSDDFETAAWRGRTHDTSVMVGGERYVISFQEFGGMIAVLETLAETGHPLSLADFERTVLLKELTKDCMVQAVEFLIANNQLRLFIHDKIE